MKQVAAIKALRSHLEDNVDAPFRTTGNEDEWPIPVVYVDDFTVEEITTNNSSLAGEVHNGDSIDRYHRHYFNLTLELMVRDNDDVGAWSILDELRASLRPLEDAPQRLHSHVSNFDLGPAGQVTHQFVEPKETEINQTIDLRSHEVRVESHADLIESINQQLNVQ